ncbi:SH3 domain-containing protein Dlish-like [Dendronephthya gigantea]|uniref:SH3 domain-containing protein Dlish-like n=1 Tax=Dendronephthya gigantea TaxID=151771 RepID=UPI00106D2BC3|nr:SH3 domain-containing protein Dlish-like [Dendronephthya gigantea]
MAFLCPTGFLSHRRRKRGTQDNSETSQELIKEVEFEPTKMIVVQDFTPCVEDELEVKRGQVVKALYQENEWRFVVAENGYEGFIPYTYCLPVDKSTIKPEYGKHFMPESHQVNAIENNSDSASVQTLNSESYQEFVKRNHGQYSVLFDFEAVQEDDVSVKQGERVVVLNKDDADWYWVKTKDGREGFTPKEYLQYHPATTHLESNHLNKQTNKEDSHLSLPAFLGDGENMKCGVKQLNAIRNFVAQGQYELTVHEGEQLFTDDKNLDRLTWIWVYSARTRQRGFVPRTHVRWAQNTTFL